MFYVNTRNNIKTFVKGKFSEKMGRNSTADDRNLRLNILCKRFLIL
jgi:hypothetical protein